MEGQPFIEYDGTERSVMHTDEGRKYKITVGWIRFFGPRFCPSPTDFSSKVDEVGTLVIEQWDGETLQGHPWHQLKEVKELQLVNCPNLVSLKGFRVPVRRKLTVMDCPNFDDYSDICVETTPDVVGVTTAPREVEFKYEPQQELELRGENCWVPVRVLAQNLCEVVPRYLVEFTDGTTLPKSVPEEDLRLPVVDAEDRQEFEIGEVVEVATNTGPDWCHGRVVAYYPGGLHPDVAGDRYEVDMKEFESYLSAYGRLSCTPKRLRKLEPRVDMDMEDDSAAKWETPDKPVLTATAERYPLAVSVEDARKANEDWMVPLDSKILKDVEASPAVVQVERARRTEYSFGEHTPPPAPPEYWHTHKKFVVTPGVRHPRRAYTIWHHDYQHLGSAKDKLTLLGYRLVKEPPPEAYPTSLPTLCEFLTR
jgi:hypothetical protein